jgi:predicted DNA-binding transcriptional regulator AlpA
VLIVEKGRNDTRHLVDVADAEIVLSVRSWAALVGIGHSTAKKLLASGQGPKVTRLTEKRIGIRMSAHAAWLSARTETYR